MDTCVAVILVCLTGAAGEIREQAALELLDSATKLAWNEPDPRGLIDSVLRAAARIDPEQACRRVRIASDRIVKMDLAPQRRSWHSSLAGLVAPHDRDLRDVLLRRGIAEAQAALLAGELWKAPDPKSKMYWGWGDPQVNLDEQNKLLGFTMRLWEAVLQSRTNPVAGCDILNRLLADARKAGFFGICVVGPYDELLLEELANLEPDLLFDPRLEYQQSKTNIGIANLCGDRAYNRWTNGQRDSFTGALAGHAVENGDVRENTLKIYKHYDHIRAYAAAKDIPASNKPGSDRSSAMGSIIVYWAWRDPDTALAAAESEPDESLRRELITWVTSVWAAKRPDQIERAILNQDNSVRRGWARKAAAEELARRAAGNPPRDTAALAVQPSRTLTAAELKARGKRRGNPEEHRILENPGDTAWLTGDKRGMYLRQAAWLSLFETGGLDGINQILNGLSDPAEIDDVLCHVAELSARTNSADTAILLWKRMKSNYRAVMTACMIAKEIAGESNDLD